MKAGGSKRRRRSGFAASILAVFALAASACGGGNARGPTPLEEVRAKDYDRENFSTSAKVDNEWFPLRPGTQLVFRGSTTEGKETIAHRVISRQEDGGNVLVQTKGDANPTPDAEPYVLPQRVLTPEHVIPYLGYLLLFLKTPLGLTFLVTLPATLLCLYLLRRIWSGGPPTTETALRGGEGAA